MAEIRENGNGAACRRWVGPAPASKRRSARVTSAMIACMVSLFTFVGCAKPIWYVAPDIAERRARKNNKPILYYFKAWDSTQHRNMLLKVLRDPRVENELRTTINIELEYGFFDEQSERYKVRKPQVCVFAAPDGARLTPNYNVNAVPTVEVFLKWLQDAKRKFSPPAGPPPTATPATKPRKPAAKME